MELLGITGTEYVGYLASVMVLISFTMKDVKKTENGKHDRLYFVYHLWVFNAYFKSWVAYYNCKCSYFGC